MLKQLLVLLEAGGTWQITDLAAELGTSPELITVMLNHLEQTGKLDLPEWTCVKACTGCAAEKTCKASSADGKLIYVGHPTKHD